MALAPNTAEMSMNQNTFSPLRNNNWSVYVNCRSLYLKGMLREK